VATDRNGQTIATGTDYLVVGTARSIGTSDTLLLQGAEGQHHVRCVNADVVSVGSVYVFVSDVAPTDLFAGRMWLDTDYELLRIYDGTDWLSSSDHVLVEVRNDTGSTLTKGSAVYVSGTHTSGKPQVALADADDATKMPAIGILPRDITAASPEGFVAVSGTVKLLALDPATYSAGDALYVSTTAGALTNTRPTAENELVQKVALVTRAHATDGTVIVMGAGRTNDTPNDSYSGRYDSTASTQRAAGDVTPLTCEVYYTARPDGDGYAESEETATPPTGARIVRRLYYSDKFNADPTVTADWTAYTTQPADGTSFATAKAALLAGLSDTDATANTRGTLPVSLKMEYEAVLDRILNDYPGATAAYGVRLLDKNYSGPCMRIRKGNTSPADTTDIYFDSEGNLDEDAIAAHCGTENGAVEIWYDQSGNGYHQVQETEASQPFIYDGATDTVVKINGKPSIIFTGAGQLQNVTHSSVTVNLMPTFNNISPSPGYTFGVMGTSGLGTYTNFMMGTSNGAPYMGFCTSAGTGQTQQGMTVTYYINGNEQISPTRTGMYTSMGSQGVAALEWTSTNSGNYRWYLNYNYFFVASLRVQEYLIYYADKSSDRSGIEDAMNDYYSVY
jgi:hypothetical protein